MNDVNALYERMAEAIVAGDADAAAALARRALDEKLDLQDVIDKGYIAGMRRVGALWESGDYFLPELITSAACMKAAMAVLKPALESSSAGGPTPRRIVIGTIEGDIHDIGKNLVSSMLSANGFDVVDLGADVKPDRFIDTAVDVGADLIGLSALLTTTMLGHRRVIERLRERGLRDRFRVLVGGAPVNRAWAEEIGADGYGENAVAAVALAGELVAAKRSS
jgi:corrinoid protein of di/trimethylamine methyltransferase